MKITWKGCLRIGITVLILYFCIHYLGAVTGFLSLLLSAVTPLVLGFVMAYVVNILMSFYEKIYFPKSKKKFCTVTRRPLCLVFSFVSLLAITALIIGLVVPELISCIALLVKEIPPAIERFINSGFVNRFLPDNLYSELSSIDWQGFIAKGFQLVASGIGDVTTAVVGAVSSVVSGITTIFIAVIFSIYLLLAKDKLTSQFYRLIKAYLPKFEKRITYVISVFNQSFRKYIVGQATEAVILGVLCTLGMWIFRFPYAGMIGALVGFTAIIPVAGAYIGAGVGAFMILTTDSPLKALFFLIFILILQQLEGNLIYPKVVGDSVGLPALWVLAAVTVGGALFGIPGMLIGVPIAAALYRLLREDVETKEKSHHKSAVEIPFVNK